MEDLHGGEVARCLNPEGVPVVRAGVSLIFPVKSKSFGGGGHIEGGGGSVDLADLQEVVLVNSKASIPDIDLDVVC